MKEIHFLVLHSTIYTLRNHVKLTRKWSWTSITKLILQISCFLFRFFQFWQSNILHLSMIINQDLPKHLNHKDRANTTKWNRVTFWKMGYSALNLEQANCSASWLVPGSWYKNWLHGNANISKPDTQYHYKQEIYVQAKSQTQNIDKQICYVGP